jgi:dephospho-CoA kinase
MVVKSTDPTLIIGVMGVTGSGKSNFIKVASKREDVIVGDSLKSCKIPNPPE